MFVYESAHPGAADPVAARPRARRARSCSEPVRAIDLAPTLLDLLGAPAPAAPNTARASCRALEGGRARRAPARLRRDLAAALLHELGAAAGAPRRALQARSTRRGPSSTTSRATPASRRTSTSRRPRPPARCARRSTGSRPAAKGRCRSGGSTARRLEKLASLGYLGAEPRAGEDPRAPDRPEPKDMIAVFNRLRRANSAVRERRFDEAAARAARGAPAGPEQRVRDPRAAAARRWAWAECREAIAFFRRYLELVPTSAYAHHWIAICHAAPRATATRRCGRPRRRSPSTRGSPTRASSAAASSRAAATTTARSRSCARRSRPTRRRPTIRLDLAQVLAEAGRASEARAEYDAVLAGHPDDAAALTGLGALQAGTGDLPGAVRSLRRALEVQPALDEARFNLAQVLERAGAAGRGRRRVPPPGRGPGHAAGHPRARAEGPRPAALTKKGRRAAGPPPRRRPRGRPDAVDYGVVRTGTSRRTRPAGCCSARCWWRRRSWSTCSG